MYFFGLAYLDKGKQNFKHSITILYIVFFILSIFLVVKSSHKCCLLPKYLSIVFCTKVFIVILLIFNYLHYFIYLDFLSYSNYNKMFH